MKRGALPVLATLASLLFWIGVAFAAERIDMTLAAAEDGLVEVGGVSVGTLFACGALLLLTAIVRTASRRIGGRAGLSWQAALTCAGLSGGYWFFAMMILYGLFAGDPMPGTSPPPPGQVYRQEAVVAAVLFALHAMGAHFWWRRAVRQAS